MAWSTLLLSFQVAIAATIIAALLGVALAAWLANGRFPGRDLVDVLLTAPMVLPPTASMPLTRRPANWSGGRAQA